MRPAVSVSLVGLLLFCIIQLLALYLWLPHRIQPAAIKRRVSSDTDLSSSFISLVKTGRKRGLTDTKLMGMLLHALQPAEHGNVSSIESQRKNESSVINSTDVGAHSYLTIVKKVPVINNTDVGTQSNLTTVKVPEIKKHNLSFNDNYAHFKPYPWDNITNPINPHNFRLVINQPNFCYTDGSEQDIFLLVLMISTPSAAKQRQMQRDSCLSITDVSGKKIRSIFLLGDSGKESVTSNVQEEASIYGDIIMEDFRESYKNLTLKTLMGIKWASVYCSHAQYIIKSDDDVYLSLRNIVNLLERSPRKSFMTGYVYTGTKPIRDKRYKWYISEESYPRKIYPPYCCGVGYIFSNDLLPGIYTESLSIPYIFLEDVFVGLCIEKLNVIPKRNPGFFAFRQDYEYCKFKRAYVVHTKKIHEIGQYWLSQQVKPANATC